MLCRGNTDHKQIIVGIEYVLWRRASAKITDVKYEEEAPRYPCQMGNIQCHKRYTTFLQAAQNRWVSLQLSQYSS